MDRYLCIHGHFYQPPRENPWLEAIEIQDSAHPYHDWNERITAECYAPNSAARLLDGDGRIIDIVSNYEQISFNFGPTLLSWMESAAPGVYRAILEADRVSREKRGGHGNAIAQVYNHIIMPLANDRDKRTQVLWGIKDFERRFRRYPEGMWLAETAVDTATLEVLAEQGIRFTILAPRQASRIRKIGDEDWQDVSDSHIDPSRAYLCQLPSGRVITLFFYDGPISQAVAFEKLLTRGEDFANRLMVGFDDSRDWPQLMHIATDGETYGHHQKFGDMALAYTLHHINSAGLAQVVNYAQYLEMHPPEYEVEIFDNSSWSCIHGIERWRDNCGCNSGGHGEWNQEWRGPLRAALDWLRDAIAEVFSSTGLLYFKDPWQVRDEYVSVVLDRSVENVDRFLERHALRQMNGEDESVVLRLLEIQRQAMLMYTSCGWFFDELSGIETVQVIKYAAAVIGFCEGLVNCGLDVEFLRMLAQAKSNILEHSDGAAIYEKFVKPSVIDVKKVGVHYAVSSLFEEYPDDARIYCYRVVREDAVLEQAGRTKLAVGRVVVTSDITRESDQQSYCVLYFGDHAFNGGVRTYRGDEAYQAMKVEASQAFASGDFAGIVRLMDKHFGVNNYSIRNLFRDEQRKVLNVLISGALEDFESSYRHMFDDNRLLMGFLQETGMPLSKPFLAAAEFILNADLQKVFQADRANRGQLKTTVDEMKRWGVAADPVNTEFAVRRGMERLMDHLTGNPGDRVLLLELTEAVTLLQSIPVDVSYWQVQNAYFRTAKAAYPDFSSRASAGDREAQVWVDMFKELGERFFFNTAAVLTDQRPPSV